MTRPLQLAPDLTLPLEAITQTFGILAVRGAGKSNAAAVMAEEMFKAKLPFVVVDPVGSWYGLRSAGDGKEPGLAVPIFGGRHGDVPLERTGGALLADLVVEHRLSCVLDVSELSEGDKTRFLIDFGEQLYRKNRDPLHLFLEEADDYCPQKPFHEQARLLRVWENIVRRGRARGLGITMITQRSAALNKNVLTQIETLLVLRTSSPQDRKAIAAWVEYHGQAKELLESLPGLDAGEAWVWSPSWLKVTQRTRIRRRWTFDSGATPKDIRGSRTPATVADVDLGAIRTRMADTIERAKAEDPRELKRRITELERQVKGKPAAAAAVVQTKTQRVEVPVLQNGQLARFEKAIGNLTVVGERLVVAAGAISDLGRSMTIELQKVRNGHQVPARGYTPTPTRQPLPTPPKGGTGESRPAMEGPISRPQQHLLDTLAWLESVRVEQPTRGQLGLAAEVSSKSSGFEKNVSVLRMLGFVRYPADNCVALTEDGRSFARPVEVPPTVEALQESLLRRVSRPQAAILRVLIDVYPRSLSRAELAAGADQSEKSSGFEKNVSTLRSFGLVAYPDDGHVVGQPVLFLEGVRP